MSLKTLITSTIFLLAIYTLNAQNIPKDSVLHKKLPVQAFAAMPVLFGIDMENGFAHDRNYTTFAGNELTLPLKSAKNYGIYGAVPLMKRKKGFAAKANLSYNSSKNKVGTVTFQEETVAEDAENALSSAYAALTLSQHIIFKKWKKRLVLSATYAASGKGFLDLPTRRGIVSAYLPLQMKGHSMFIIGATGIIGKNIQKPIIPHVIYFRKLGRHVNFEGIFPMYGQLRYVFSEEAAIVLGAKTVTRTPYLEKDFPILQSFDDALEFKSKNLRYFLNVEKAINKLLWFNIEAGYNRSLKAILNTPNKDLRNKLFVGQDFGYSYVKVGLFLRPVFSPKMLNKFKK